MTRRKILIWSVAAPLVTITLLVSGCFACAVYSLRQQTTVDTDPATFPKNLDQWQQTGLVSHFPSSIPSQATEIRFSETPGFLQGGGHIQLHLVLPASDVQSIVKKMTSQAIHIYPGGGSFSTQVNAINGVPTTRFHTSPTSEIYDFPPDFTFYVLTSASSSGGTNPSWNHGNSSGVVVNTVTNEVVYWAEQW